MRLISSGHRSKGLAPGFTLFELLVYLAIMSTVLVTILLMVNNMFMQHAKVRGSYVIWDNLDYAKRRITYAVQNADSVTAPVSGSSTSLLLAMSSTDTSDTLSFALSNDQITMSVRGETPVWITTPEVKITSLGFERMQGTVPMIRFTLAGKLNSLDPAFQGTIQMFGMASNNR